MFDILVVDTMLSISQPADTQQGQAYICKNVLPVITYLWIGLSNFSFIIDVWIENSQQNNSYHNNCYMHNYDLNVQFNLQVFENVFHFGMFYSHKSRQSLENKMI